MFAAWVSRWLPVAALTVTLIAVIDPLEGFPIVLMGGVLTVMAALQERSPWLRLALAGLVIAALGCAAMIALSMAGGVGEVPGRSRWWLLALTPYPVGVVLFIAADVLILRARSLR